jgi:hypothetical protein
VPISPIAAMNPPSPVESEPTRPLVSVTSLLILSGFLIGVAVGQGVADDLSPYVLSCGLAGVLAYLGFDCAASRRRERELLKEHEQFMSRLNRHVVHPQGSATDSEPSAAAAAVKRELAQRGHS